MVPGCLASSVPHPSPSLSAMMVLRFLFGEIRLFKEASNGFSASLSMGFYLGRPNRFPSLASPCSTLQCPGPTAPLLWEGPSLLPVPQSI